MTVEPEMLKLAEQILQSKATDFDPSQFVDRYEEALSSCSRRSRPASRSPASVLRRGRRMWRISWTRFAAALHRRKPHPLRRRSHPNALTDRARCCFRLPAKPKRWRRQSRRIGLAPDRRMSVDPICHRCPIAARISRRKLEIPKIQPASGMPVGVP